MFVRGFRSVVNSLREFMMFWILYLRDCLEKEKRGDERRGCEALLLLELLIRPLIQVDGLVP